MHGRVSHNPETLLTHSPFPAYRSDCNRCDRASLVWYQIDFPVGLAQRKKASNDPRESAGQAHVGLAITSAEISYRGSHTNRKLLRHNELPNRTQGTLPSQTCNHKLSKSEDAILGDVYSMLLLGHGHSEVLPASVADPWPMQALLDGASSGFLRVP